jgi:hypothetical protein
MTSGRSVCPRQPPAQAWRLTAVNLLWAAVLLASSNGETLLRTDFSKDVDGWSNQLLCNTSSGISRMCEWPRR